MLFRSNNNMTNLDMLHLNKVEQVLVVVSMQEALTLEIFLEISLVVEEVALEVLKDSVDLVVLQEEAMLSLEMI